jgi:hypothetical protein
LIFRIDASHDRCMLELLLVVARALALALRGHRVRAPRHCDQLFHAIVITRCTAS